MKHPDLSDAEVIVLWQQRVRSYNARERRLRWQEAGIWLCLIALLGIAYFPPGGWSELSIFEVVMLAPPVLLGWGWHVYFFHALKCPRCGKPQMASSTICRNCHAPLSESADFRALYDDGFSWRDGCLAVGTALSFVAFTALMLNSYIPPFGLGFRHVLLTLITYGALFGALLFFMVARRR